MINDHTGLQIKSFLWCDGNVRDLDLSAPAMDELVALVLDFRMKFWSCCQRKTTEFDKFLEQQGCETGKHKWVASKVSRVTDCGSTTNMNI